MALARMALWTLQRPLLGLIFSVPAVLVLFAFVCAVAVGVWPGHPALRPPRDD